MHLGCIVYGWELGNGDVGGRRGYSGRAGAILGSDPIYDSGLIWAVTKLCIA